MLLQRCELTHQGRKVAVVLSFWNVTVNVRQVYSVLQLEENHSHADSLYLPEKWQIRSTAWCEHTSEGHGWKLTYQHIGRQEEVQVAYAM